MGGCRVPHPKPALSVVEGPALAWVGILLGSWGRRLAQRPITQAPVVSPRFAYLPRHSAVTWASAITPGLRKPVEDKRRLKLNRLIHSFGILDYRGDGEQVGSAPSVEGTPLGGPLSPRCRTEAKSIWLRTRPVNRVLPLTFTLNRYFFRAGASRFFVSALATELRAGAIGFLFRIRGSVFHRHEVR